eukprot:TRINITY_DN12049_c0_g1_i3.p1 TRINITY_DN12049_c0_g1~~TRINITY_DN12049_c0_g1_i3.p1  ORF type:complete len:134 (-),score=15.97 TRINITY_DN12049_c0_g1_i3:132-533(-)
MIRRPPRSTQSRSSAASDVYKRQFIGSALRKLASISPFTVDKFETFVNNFVNNLPQESKLCFSQSKDVQKIQQCLGIHGLTTSEIRKRALENLIKHLFKVRKFIKQTDKDWNINHDWEEAGRSSVLAARQIFG